MTLCVCACVSLFPFFSVSSFPLPALLLRLLLTRGTGHDLHKVVLGLPPLELLHQVLDVPEAVGDGEAQQNLAVLLQRHLLEVLVPTGGG